MRTNIELDEQLVKEAFRYTDATTKKELVIVALREFIENHKRQDVRELVGKVSIEPTYNHKELRARKKTKNVSR